jgi:hypothetical protein
MVSSVSQAWTACGGLADFSDAFQRDLVARLVEPDAAAALSKEMVDKQVALDDLAPVVGVRIIDVPGTRAPCDLWIVWEHAESETSVPANVKTERTDRRSRVNRGCALGPLMSWLTDIDGKIDRVSHGLDVNQMIVELLNGNRSLIEGRDYLLVVVVDGKVEIRSLIARHRENGIGLAVARHPNRDISVYRTNAGPVIGPGIDIARELAHAFLPAGGSHRVRAELIALTPVRRRRRIAKALAVMPDKELLGRITGRKQKTPSI